MAIPAWRTKVRPLIKRGWKNGEIAKYCGVDISTVERFLSQRGVSNPYRTCGRLDGRLLDVKDLSDMGEYTSDMARYFRVGVTKMRKYLIENELPHYTKNINSD